MNASNPSGWMKSCYVFRHRVNYFGKVGHVKYQFLFKCCHQNINFGIFFCIIGCLNHSVCFLDKILKFLYKKSLHADFMDISVKRAPCI